MPHTSQQDKWTIASRDLLAQNRPFDEHLAVHKAIFPRHDLGINDPVWWPTQDDLITSNSTEFIKTVGLNSYDELLTYSQEQPEEFTAQMLKRLGIVLDQPYTQVLSHNDHPENARWLSGATLNIANSCFQAPSTSIAIRQENSDGSISDITYAQLQQSTLQVCHYLQAHGIGPGDRVGLVMPMHATSVSTYLGIIASGASAVTLAESFAVEEMRIRFDISQPKLVITQDVTPRGDSSLPLYAKVIEATDCPCLVHLSQTDDTLTLRAQDDDMAPVWATLENATIASRDPHDEITVIFSSGTTGNPKAIPWDHTTPLKSAFDAHHHHDLKPGDVLCWPTSLGWMMGPWVVFATLINRGTMAFNTNMPTTGAFGKFVQDAQVNVLGLVPSLVKAWRKRKCMEAYDWSAIRTFSSTGECSNGEDMFYLSYLAGYKPIIEYCGGTETGGGYITGTRMRPCIPGTFNTPALGSHWVLLDEDNQLSETGEVFFSGPSLGLSHRLLNRDHREAYFDDTPHHPTSGTPLRRHGDQIKTLDNGFFLAQGRMDDAMNLGGIKVSAIQIEELLVRSEGVDDIAAIEVPPPGGGPGQLVLFVVTSGEVTTQTISKDLQQRIKSELNPLFKIHDVRVIESLPRTASNKVMRRSLRDHYNQQLETAS